MPTAHTVHIRRTANKKKCLIVPDKFKARLGDTINFKHDGLPMVQIVFRGGISPFERSSFDSGPTPHTVIAEGSFEFDVSWDEIDGPGSGDGTGVVPPG